MELNREEIIKALECCQTQYNRNCNECPYERHRKCSISVITCESLLRKDLLTLIKQLTEENNQFADIGKMYSEIRAEAKTEVAREIFAELEQTVMHPNWASQTYKEWYFAELKKKYIGE